MAKKSVTQKKSGSNEFQPRDFIETHDNLYFAVLDGKKENNKVLCWLRYYYQNNEWQKFDTNQAEWMIENNYPHIRYYSKRMAAWVHGITYDQIKRIYKPKDSAKSIQERKYEFGEESQAIKADTEGLMQWLIENGVAADTIGITGSILINAQNGQSDIDVVIYDAINFNRARDAVKGIKVDAESESNVKAQNNEGWYASWERRRCELTFEEYKWHEQRKGTQALFNGRKFDLALIIQQDDECETEALTEKLGSIAIYAKVIDASKSFHQPARYVIEHTEIREIISHTQTYTGQAVEGEWVEVQGQLERTNGEFNIIVGSSREAAGEFIRIREQDRR